ETGVLISKQYIVVDRDAKYTDSFVQLLASTRIQVIRLPPSSPNLNAYAERFVRPIKKECLEKMIFCGQASLHRAISEYVKRYHFERNHQGLGNALIRQQGQKRCGEGRIRRRPRLGGMLNHYEPVAARRSDREFGRYALPAAVKARLAELDRIWEKEQTKAEVEIFILDEVFASLPTPPFTSEEKELVAQNGYAHVWQQAVSGTFARAA
ncbi:MAG: integrase core domain-containing protein, partial [Pirellulaceae bacterium]